MTTRAFSGTVRVVVPSCNARQSAPCHSSSRVPVWMSRPLVACGGGVLLAIGAVVAVHPIIEPLYHVSSAASPYSPMWRIMDPLAALAVVLGVIGGSRRTRRVAHDGAAPITREWLAANALCYGFLCVGILCFWNWFNLLRPAFTAVGTDTSDVVWGVHQCRAAAGGGHAGPYPAARRHGSSTGWLFDARLPSAVETRAAPIRLCRKRSRPCEKSSTGVLGVDQPAASHHGVR